MKRDFVTGRRKEIPLDEEETSIFMCVLTSIYMYLFVIVLAIVMAVNSMAASWEKDIMGALTVQIIPIEDENKHIDSEKTLEQQNKVLQFMENVSGVKSVRVLSSEDIEKLMTPWLGNKIDISELPIPALLDVGLKNDGSINYDEITRGLKQITPNATIDNHRLWLNKLLKFASSLKQTAMLVLLLVIGICAFSIYYSTRTSLWINRETLEILHVVGATDKYIAKQYALTYAKIGFFSGIVGLLIAIPCIILIGKYGLSTESGLISGAKLSVFAWGLIMMTPLFSSIYSMITSYITVKHSLEKLI